MSTADDNVIRTMDTTEVALNDLFKEVLDGLRDDIVEAQTNVKMYLDAVAIDSGKDMYGTLLNTALQVKGSARDRQLKFLNVFKDRVTKKEAVELTKELKGQIQNTQKMDIGEMNKMLEEMKNNGKLDSFELDIDEDDE